MTKTIQSSPTTFAEGFWIGLFSPILAGIAVALVTPVILARAYAATLIWAWYFVPGFGAQPLSFVTAIGVVLGASLLKGRLKTPANAESAFQSCALDLLAISITVAIAYVAKAIF